MPRPESYSLFTRGPHLYRSGTRASRAARLGRAGPRSLERPGQALTAGRRLWYGKGTARSRGTSRRAPGLPDRRASPGSGADSRGARRCCAAERGARVWAPGAGRREPDAGSRAPGAHAAPASPATSRATATSVARKSGGSDRPPFVLQPSPLQHSKQLYESFERSHVSRPRP